MPPVFYWLSSVLLGLVLLRIAYRVHRRIRRRRERKRIGAFWSIGYQRSSHPLRWDPASAKVYSRDRAADDVRTLADPFMIRRGGQVFLFCEVILASSPHGKIAVSLYDERRDTWDYEGIALDEPFHLSYPYVFAHRDEIYMIPESKGARSVRLYRATSFPHEWTLEKILIESTKRVDPSIVFWNDRCYLFASRRRRLYLYHADSLTGDWKLHRRSPVRRWNHARCAGRIIEHDGSLYRFAQEQAAGYGSGVHGFRILELSGRSFEETPLAENPLFEPFGQGWAATGMHHLDVLRLGREDYLAVFDGQGVGRGAA